MFEKLRMSLRRNVTMADHMELLAEIYGDSSGFTVEEQLPYEIYRGHGTYFSYGEWVRFSNRFANVLRDKLGVKKGDRVAIIPGNGIEALTAIMATMQLGAIAVPMNYMLRGREIKHIVEDSGAKVLITDPEVFNSNIQDTSLLPTVRKWVMAGVSGKAPDGFESLDLLLEGTTDEFIAEKMDPDDVVGIFYTSGTTGFPKGAMVTSRGLVGAQRKASVILPMSKKDIGIFALPIAHVFGFAICVMAACAGVSGYVMRHFDPVKCLELIEEQKATLFVGVPAMYAFMLASNPEKYDLSSLRLIGSSADAMPPDHIERIRNLAARPGLIRKRRPLFAEAYGMVELTGLATLKPAFSWLEWPPGCIGIPMPPIRAKVADDNGVRLKRGEPGELWVKGPGVTPGYWNNPEATENALVNGWLRTGDMVRMDRLGRVFFVDRVKDVIKCGGYSVFSVEVEEEILYHPDVQEVAVIGIPHRKMGHVPLAVVCLKEGSELTEEELADWCRENIASYRAPRMVRIIPIEEMPYGMTLKIMKKDLRTRFADEIGVLE
ncbi:MAG: acyl--CoA ligase [Actinobacteria bacterium]|nr:acyl--CoA ligase [Actinomycetota bacterium]MCG2818215.1 acyl--CoA ligase [Actinomycetes bacterium]MBU4219612.1 acyl--CoA ligase [Actinomycetota bacterium]MBU4358453.1 acyl--CoA ligase [Actinomycetota bacterium]MBU4392470.1 acyl--CoA ligase [Actinomycetota bacterium]